jgi:hypothetical protein
MTAPTAAVSLFTGRSALGKAIRVNSDSTLSKTPLANSVCAVCTKMVATAGQLAELLDGCEAHHALALGTCDRARARVVTAERQATVKGAVARTKANFKFAAGQGWALLDIDCKDAPPEITTKLDRLGGVWSVLATVYPPLKTAARVRRNSQSACVRLAGEPPFASLSEHIYILLERGTDTVALVERLYQRLWLAGFGWVAISKAGQLLGRSLIDCAVASPERLIFEGPPIFNAPFLYVDARLRVVTAREGVAIQAPPPLSDEHEMQYESHVQTACKSLRKQAERIGYEYQRARAADDATAKAFTKGVTRSSVILPLAMHLRFKGGEVVTVREALLDPSRYVGGDCLDPAEPVLGDYCARFLRGKKDHTCFIKSFAHGGQVYQLQYDFATAQVAIVACPENKRGEAYWSIINKFAHPNDRPLDSGAKRNALKKSGSERPFQARQSRLGKAS